MCSILKSEAPNVCVFSFLPFLIFSYRKSCLCPAVPKPTGWHWATHGLWQPLHSTGAVCRDYVFRGAWHLFWGHPPASSKNPTSHLLPALLFYKNLVLSHIDHFQLLNSKSKHFKCIIYIFNCRTSCELPRKEVNPAGMPGGYCNVMISNFADILFLLLI